MARVISNRVTHEVRDIFAMANMEIDRIMMESREKIQEIISHADFTKHESDLHILASPVPAPQLGHEPELETHVLPHQLSECPAPPASELVMVVPAPSLPPNAWQDSAGSEAVGVSPRRDNPERSHSKEELALILGLSKPLTVCERIVKHPFFDTFSSIIILSGAVSVGYQTQYSAVEQARMAEENSLRKPVHMEALVGQGLFAFLFTAEVLMRWFSSGLYGFFMNELAAWNGFDVSLLLFSLADFIMELVMLESKDGEESPLRSFVALRIVRVVRLVRAVRVIRVLRFFRELRIMLFSIMSCFKSLFWVLAIMTLVIYIFSVGFTTAALSKLTDLDSWQSEETKDLILFFGTLSRAMLSLFQAMSGGNDWCAFYDALESVGAFWQLAFLVYVSFALFAVINIVTGVFVESAVELANNDREARIYEQLELKRRSENELNSIFEVMDQDQNGTIRLEDFELFLQSDHALALFRDLNIQAHEALRLFNVLDEDNSGFVVASEFVEGCMDMQGFGSAYNQMIMLKELTDIKRYMKDLRKPARATVAKSQTEPRLSA